MKAKEVKENVFKIVQGKRGIKIFFVLKKESKKIVKIVNIADEQEKNDTTSGEMLDGFCSIVSSTFNNYEDSMEILKLSSADERKNGLYYYDLDELPEEMKCMKEVVKNSEKFETFNFKDDSLEEVVAFVVIIGDAERNIVLYKQQYAISLLRRDKYMLAKVPHKDRLAKVNQDIIRVDFNFQFCLLDDIFLVSDIDKMEKICSFHTLIINEAKKSIDMISDVDIVDNIDVLIDELENVTFARKLTRIYKDSKVLGNVPNKVIIEFTKKHSYFEKNPLKSSNDKFVLDTKKSKETFVKLMNDDFLKSELTNYEYESLAKNDM